MPTAASTRPPALTSRSVDDRGTGLDHVRGVAVQAGVLGGVGVDAADRVPRAWRAWDIRPTRARPPPPTPTFHRRAGDVGQSPGRCGVEDLAERAVQQGQQRLGLGIAEAGVELDHPQAARGQRQGRRRTSPTNGVPRSRSRSTAGRITVSTTWSTRPSGAPRQRGVGTHPAGVGAVVMIEDPFEVLRGLHRQDRRPVGDREQAHLRPVQELLDHHRPSAVGDVIQGDPPVVGDHDPLAGGETVVLDHVRRAELVQCRRGLLAVTAGPPGRGRHPGGVHDLLGEGLAALELRGCPGRTEARDPGCSHRVGHPGDQRRLGPDHHQVDAELGGQRGDGITVHRIDRVQRRDLPDPGVARRGVHLGHPRVGDQGPGQRVLAPAGPDHQYAQSRVSARPGRGERAGGGRGLLGGGLSRSVRHGSSLSSPWRTAVLRRLDSIRAGWRAGARTRRSRGWR